MTVELITETSNVKGRDERAEQEQYAKEASAIAYAGIQLALLSWWKWL